jgi:hypothetical protein
VQAGHNALLLPGVIAKRAAGLYYSGKRTREWLKFKAAHEQEVVIVGHTEPRRSRKYFGSLVLAVRDKANKRHVGTGFDQAALKSLYETDPMVGKRIGGVNVFGGGLGLYKDGKRIGGLGISGDTACTDHMVAWRVRHLLSLDDLGQVGGVSGDAKRPDNIVFDITPNPSGGTGISKGGFGHPNCLNNPDPSTLPPVKS